MSPEFMNRIRDSTQWQRAAPWGEPRPGHPEGSIGRHVEFAPRANLAYHGVYKVGISVDRTPAMKPKAGSSGSAPQSPRCS